LFALYKIMNQLQKSQEDFRKIILSVERSQGAVKIFMNGLQEVVEVRLGPEARVLMKENQLTRELTDAYNEALRTSRRLLKEEVSRLTGITNIPDIPGIF
jgi:DNA-binding protein YbaB